VRRVTPITDGLKSIIHPRIELTIDYKKIEGDIYGCEGVWGGDVGVVRRGGKSAVVEISKAKTNGSETGGGIRGGVLSIRGTGPTED